MSHESDLAKYPSGRRLTTAETERHAVVVFNEICPVMAGSIIRSNLTSSISDTDIRGRIEAPKINIDLIEHWIQACDPKHDECRSTSPSVGNHTIRLLDVEQGSFVSAPLAEDYVALSYVWGQRHYHY